MEAPSHGIERVRSGAFRDPRGDEAAKDPFGLNINRCQKVINVPPKRVDFIDGYVLSF